MRKKKKNQKILAQVGLLVTVLFTVSAVINGIFIYYRTSENYIDMLQTNTEHVLRQTKTSMEEYKALPWLLDYWQIHHKEMELPGDISKRAGKVMRMLLDKRIEDAEMVTPEQAASFSASEQQQFAEYCYLQIQPRYYDLKDNFSVENLYCCTDTGTLKRMFPFFQARTGGEQSLYDNIYALGENWPFNVRLHPAVVELYEKREDRVYYERVTSTVDDIEYLIGYLPILMDGDVRCYICASYEMTEIKDRIVGDLRIIELTNVLVIGSAGVMLLFLIYWTVLRNLSFVQKAIQAYREDKDSTAVVKKMSTITSRNEVEQLAEDLSAMAVELDRYTREMIQMNVEKERIDTELSLATRIQADMLPSTYPAFPEYPEFDIYATMTPAMEVGGDFYDFFMIDDTHLGIVMADVSGKGIPACLYMVVSKILLQNYAVTGRDPAQVLKDVNDKICSQNREDMFVTVWFGILDIVTGVITAANAGHEYPALRQPDGVFETVNDKHGFVVGGMEGIRYREYKIHLKPGAKLFLYTDGVPEASNVKEEMFGMKRMLDALNKAPGASLETILAHVRADVNDFVGDAQQFDDLTMLCLEYKGRGDGSGAVDSE